jgi:uncharacterized protein YdeI (YjbR/CyaY-like superfamily)
VHPRTLSFVQRHVDGREIVEVPDRASWRQWLAERHEQRDSIWLIFHKQTSDGSSPSYEEAVEEALCFGWIDSTVNRLDEKRTLQLFAPRKPRGTWSASNKERVARLEREGRLAPSGIAAIELAKENGSWSALDAVERLEEPPELAAALDDNASARENWNGFSPSSRKAILWWIVSAKRPETRAKRVEQTVRMAARGLRAQFDHE